MKTVIYVIYNALTRMSTASMCCMDVSVVCVTIRYLGNTCLHIPFFFRIRIVHKTTIDINDGILKTHFFAFIFCCVFVEGIFFVVVHCLEGSAAGYRIG